MSPGVVADPPVAEFGGLDPNLILPDLVQIFDPGAAAAAVDPTALSMDLSTLFGANLAPDLTSLF